MMACELPQQMSSRQSMMAVASMPTSSLTDLEHLLTEKAEQRCRKVTFNQGNAAKKRIAET